MHFIIWHLQLPGPRALGRRDQRPGFLRAEVPNLWAVDQYQSGPVRNQTAQQEVRLNVMHLNHSETIPPPPVCEKKKMSSMKPVPGAKKVGDCCLRE